VAKLSLELKIRLLEIVFNHVVEGIPVYGRLLKLTAELAEAIRQDAEGKGIDFDRSTIAAIRTLPPAIVKAEVERALSTRTDLPAESLPTLKRELEQVPVQFAAIIAEIEELEARGRRQAREAEVKAVAARRTAKREALRKRLEREVSAHSFREAYTTLMDLREAGEWSRDLSKLERFIFRRTHVADLPEDWPVGVVCLVWLAWGIWLRNGCFSICLIVFGLLTFAGLFEALVPSLEWACLPISIRRSMARVVLATPFIATLVWFLVFRK